MFCFSRSLFPRQVNGFIVPFREDPVTEIQVHCCALNRGCDGPRSHFAPLGAPGLGALCHVVLTLASWNQSLPGIIAPVLGGVHGKPGLGWHRARWRVTERTPPPQRESRPGCGRPQFCLHFPPDSRCDLKQVTSFLPFPISSSIKYG